MHQPFPDQPRSCRALGIPGGSSSRAPGKHFTSPSISSTSLPASHPLTLHRTALHHHHQHHSATRSCCSYPSEKCDAAAQAAALPCNGRAARRPPVRSSSSSTTRSDPSASSMDDEAPSFHGSLAERARAGHSPGLRMPSPPRPSADAGIRPPAQAPPDESDALPSDLASFDIFNISPLAALRLLTETVEELLRDHVAAEAAAAALPTPPNSLGATPHVSTGSHEEVSAQASSGGGGGGGEESPPGPGSPGAHHHEDIPRSHKTPIGSPETHPTDAPADKPGSPSGLDLASSDAARTMAADNASAAAAAAQEQRMLRRRLARKFYSKAVPPVPLRDYLRRLHTYCPMSAAVYLTAGIYLERLVAQRPRRRIPRRQRRRGDVFEDIDDYDSDPLSPQSGSDDGQGSHASGPEPEPEHDSDTEDEDEDDEDADPILPITPRTVHRLLLGALRVATKALEDLSYSHTRFAKVGGVSDKELTRLEVNFLFLVRFHLIVGPRRLQRGARRMVQRSLAIDAA